MPWQIRLHWLVAILLVITCVTIELRGFAEPGSAPWYVLVVTHFSCGVTVFALMIARLFLRWRHPFARYRAQTAEVANRPGAPDAHPDLPAAANAAGTGGVLALSGRQGSGICSACRCRSPTWRIGRRRG